MPLILEYSMSITASINAKDKPPALSETDTSKARFYNNLCLANEYFNQISAIDDW